MTRHKVTPSISTSHQAVRFVTKIHAVAAAMANTSMAARKRVGTALLLPVHQQNRAVVERSKELGPKDECARDYTCGRRHRLTCDQTGHGKDEHMDTTEELVQASQAVDGDWWN
eukprot:CAMPEP_0185330038 /NCGR_PEP_ID=MMETSP1363-20130426/76513_1 /TAXON_ID=38817 /ORGANISM="Gephyrocapsa oceanica, Strain RCC1303" /LENGTH=113 /DNA_ID=CAMNT_0027928873 /DNA_START=351 /DNA_END=691 /DNA_ORIENTATION=-